MPPQFAASLNSRNVVRSAHFALHWRCNALPIWRLGLVMSKRFAARAVERNVYKRALREAFRLQLAQVQNGDRQNQACDVVVRLLPAVKQTPAVKMKRPAPVKPLPLRLLRQQSHVEATWLMRQVVARLEKLRCLPAAPGNSTVDSTGVE